MIELLRGVRVLECAILPTGDHTGRLLGDLGADVLKIERPGDGDYLRQLPPMIVPDHGIFHLWSNRNKESLTLNLRSSEGREIFFKLLAEADVFIDGFAGDACERLGIGYEEQRKIKPDIIYCQSNGFGVRTPYAQIPVHGYMMGALAGAATLQVRDDGLVEEIPPPIGAYWPGQIDGPLLGAVWAAFTTVAAVTYRNTTGKGVYIDCGGADAILASRGTDSTMGWNKHSLMASENPPPPARMDPRQRPKYTFYETKDEKFVMLAAIEPKFWANFCGAVERPDLLRVADPDAIVDFQMVDADDSLAYVLQSIFRARTREEWIDLALAHDIPLSPANRPEDLIHEPHFTGRDVIHKSTHPTGGTFTTIGWPAVIGGQRYETAKPAPQLGEHTGSVLRTLGYSDSEIASLRTSGVV